MYKATDALTPVAVPGLSGAVTISADPYDSCALLSAGIVDCWGLDAGLESGVPQPAAGDTSTPIAVRGLVRVKAFAHSFDGQQGIHSCAVLASGTVKCTSTNPYAGQLGNGTLSSKATKTPATVTGLRDAIAISASDFYTCALRSGGSVVCWGDNHYGQLGDGTTITRSRPVTVQGFGQPVTPAGGGSKAVPVLGDALFGEVGFGHARPAQIGTSGVIAGYIAGDVHWSHWGAARTTGTGIGLWLPPGATTESDKQRTPVKVVAYDLGVCKGKRAYLQMDVYFPRHGGRFRPGPYDGICH
jgi:hypothetical protein